MDELQELLARLSGAVTEEDMEDPEISALMSQLMTILKPEGDTLPPQMIEQLSQIEDKRERFYQAAQMMNAMDMNSLHALAEKMRASGLLKGEWYEREETERS